MSQIVIDDAQYIDAQQFLGKLHWDRETIGQGIAFERWVRSRNESLTAERMKNLDGMLRELMDYSEGRYFASTEWSENKTLVWTFHRAWVDRFGWCYGVPSRPDDAAG